jgi:tetratricopeptide (TPR) repeat protein
MKAAELDSTAVDNAALHPCGKWDWECMEKNFLKDIENNPNMADFREYSHLLIWLGRNEEAIKQIEIAVKLDPVSAFTLTWYGVVLTFAHKYDEAIKAFQDALKIEPIYPFASGNLANAFALSGKYKEAVEQLELSCGSDTELVNAIKEGYSEGGFKGACISYAKVAELRYKESYWLPFDIANQYVLAGEKDKAIYWLEQAYKDHDPNLPYLLYPIWDSLRNDPRFQDICKKMNLPYK